MGEKANLSKTMRIDLPPEVLGKPTVTHPRPVTPTQRDARMQTRTAETDSASPQVGDSNFQELFLSIYDGCLITDLSGRILDANTRAMQFLDFDRAELSNRNILEILSGADGALLATIKETLEKDRFVLIQAYCVRQHGSMFPAEVSTNLLRLTGHDYLCFFIRDITGRVEDEEERARMLEELKRSNEDLQEFAYVVSHDLQEPLRKITTFGGLFAAKAGALVPEEARDYLNRMQDAAARMQELIMALLALSRVSTRAQPFATVDLNETIAGVLSDIELRISQTGARIDVGVLPVVEAEPIQMRQLFQNLIGNAIKFQRPGVAPVVNIRRDPVREGELGEGEWCVIIVEDNGIGFDPKHAERVFGIFQRLHNRTEYDGTGIGLAVCRKILERHGGTIVARGQPGQGSRFILCLPLRRGAES